MVLPLFATDEAHRLSVAHDDPQRVDAVVREMLDAGNAYRAGYGAVLHAPRDIPVPDAEMPPCLITACDGDPLQDHIDRLGPMPRGWNARKVATPDDHHQASLEHLRAGDRPDSVALPEVADQGFVAIATDGFQGLVHWRGTRFVLHAPGGSCETLDDADALMIDLPGHGLSDDWPASADDWARIAA